MVVKLYTLSPSASSGGLKFRGSNTIDVVMLSGPSLPFEPLSNCPVWANPAPFKNGRSAMAASMRAPHHMARFRGEGLIDARFITASIRRVAVDAGSPYGPA